MKNITLTVVFSLLSASTSYAAYKEKSVTAGGSINGTVQFSGEVPILEKFLIAKDNAACGEGEVIPNPVSVGTNGALQHVVVFLDKIKAGKAWPTKEFKLNQLKCRFEPYVQVMRKKGKLTITNSDAVLHNVHPFEHIGSSRRTMFNMAQPNLGQTNIKKIKTRKGQVVELSCDAHSWMAGWLYVLEHPYFSVVTEAGGFEIKDVPAGTYKLKAWHPVLKFKEQKIEVKANGSVTANFAFMASN